MLLFIHKFTRPLKSSIDCRGIRAYGTFPKERLCAPNNPVAKKAAIFHLENSTNTTERTQNRLGDLIKVYSIT